jgi:MFS family permease
MASGAVTLSSYIRLVRSNRNFRMLWLAQMVSEIGDWLYAVAVYSLLLDITGKASSVATAVVLQVLPQVLVAPMAGALNDRLSRRSVMIFADLVRCVVVLGMLAASRFENIYAMYMLLLMETVMWGFFEPGRSAMIPNVVEKRDDIIVANALGSTTWSLNLAIGSALGGLLAVVFGRSAVFAINAVSFLVSAYFLTRMRVVEPHVADNPPFRPRDLLNFTPVIEGFRYVRGDAKLLATLLAKAGLGLMGAHYVILPIFGERIFPVGLAEYGPRRAGMLGMSLLMGARGVGALIGPLAGGYWAGRSPDRMRLGILFGFLAACVGYASLSVAPNIWLAAATVMVGHAGGSMVWVFSTTMLQTQTDDRFRGRVFSVDFAFLVLSMSVSTHVGGLVVDAGVPVRQLSLGVGLLAIVPAVLWLFRAMPLWRIPRT